MPLYFIDFLLLFRELLLFSLLQLVLSEQQAGFTEFDIF